MEGGNLADHVAANDPLTGEQLVGLAVGLAEAVVAIHASGVIHRDLKPNNVLMAANGPKLVDFGISHALNGTSVTQIGAVVGSPSWMAPEQAQGRATTPAVDVFSWGATVAFAATGRSPFGEGRPDAVIYRVVHEEPDLSGVDPKLRPLVASALSKDPTGRPAPDQLLIGVVKSAMVGDVLPPGGSGAMTTLVLDRTWKQPERVIPPSRRQGHRVAMVAASAIVIASFVAAALYVVHGAAKTPKHDVSLSAVDQGATRHRSTPFLSIRSRKVTPERSRRMATSRCSRPVGGRSQCAAMALVPLGRRSRAMPSNWTLLTLKRRGPMLGK